MLSQLSHHTSPFHYFHVTSTFSMAECAALEHLFLQAENWQHREGGFYRCALKDVSAYIPVTFTAELISRMREITGLPLVDRCVVTAQQMMPGHAIGVHSDRPLLGYEIARLVVQLNRQWQPDHGGVLNLYESPDSEAVVHVNPLYNEAFGFLLHAASHHSVTEVTELRKTIVFNFWHAANTPELAAYVQALFANIHFSELPVALDSIAMSAESKLPEEITLLAGTAAVALQRWGYHESTVMAGYIHSAGLYPCDAFDAESYAAVLLADWVARLYRDSFDLTQWEILRSKLQGIEMYSRLKPTWELCLPNV